MEGLRPSPASLDGVKADATIRFQLAWKQTPANLPVIDGQTVSSGPDGTVIVRVKSVKPDKPSAIPYAGSDPAALAALKPSRLIESDDLRIVRLARQIAGSSTDALSVARNLEAFVRQFLAKEPGLGTWESAGQAAAARRGDSTEHAVLTAALCRAVGIPADVAVGLTYAPRYHDRPHVFVPHAWTRAYVGGQWIGLDAAAESFSTSRVALAVSLDAEFDPPPARQIQRPTTQPSAAQPSGGQPSAAQSSRGRLADLFDLTIRQVEVETPGSGNHALIAALLAAACFGFVILRQRRKMKARQED